MNSNDVVNTRRGSVFVTLTARQAEILREELTARRRYHAGRAGYLNGKAGRAYHGNVAGPEGSAEEQTQAEALDVLIGKVRQAEEEASAWIEQGLKVTDETNEMRLRGTRLAGAYIGESNAQALIGAHLVTVTEMDWLRLWAALRNKMCGLLLVNDEEYAPHSGTEPGCSLIFPMRLRCLMERIAGAFRDQEPKGDELVLIADRKGLGYIYNGLKRAYNVAKGRAGHYGSRWTSNPAKAAQFKTETDYLRELLAGLERARVEPIAVPYTPKEGEAA